MLEYTFEDLIINPENPSLESLIGKEVYFHDIPLSCLGYANKNYCIGTLKEIRKNDFYPFRVKTSGGAIMSYVCIIPKKEEPKKYVPFETLDEFIESYKKAEERIDYSNIEGYIASCGMWLKDTDRKGAYFMVTEIWNEGVVVSDIKMKTTKEGNDEYYTTNESTEWKELFRDYTFLDGSPCGKEVK